MPTFYSDPKGLFYAFLLNQDSILVVLNGLSKLPFIFSDCFPRPTFSRFTDTLKFFLQMPN